MSLDTLLEAAEFLEAKKWRTPPKARDEDSLEDQHYSKTSSLDDNGDSSLDSSHGQGGFGDDPRDKRRYGGAGTREVHNKLEKNRRAHLKECFDVLKKQIPFMEDKKTSNLSILRGSLKYIQNLKRKEKEYEQELQRLADEKTRLRDRITTLKLELADMNIEVDLMQWMQSQEQETNSTSTASEGCSPIVSEAEEDLEEEDSPTLQRIAPKSVINCPVKGVALGLVPPVMPGLVGQGKPLIRPPVTQILHETVTQRQALHRQQQALAASRMRAMQPVSVKPAVGQIQSPFTLGSIPTHTSIPHSGGPAAVIPMTSISKALGQQFLVATTTLSSNHTGTTGVSTSAILNHLNSVITTPTTVTTATSVPIIKPLFASQAAAAQIMSGQLTFNPLIAGLPKTTGQMLSTVAVPSVQTQMTAVPHHLMSLAHVGLNNMAAVVSPGVPGALNNVLSQQALLKQLPLLQPHLLASGQVIGTTSAGKPVVVVSMPNVATTTTPTVQVTPSTS